MEGKSRGMVVVRSRLHCVRYKMEFEKQIKELGLPYGCLVGFSGTVFDIDTHKEYTVELNELFTTRCYHTGWNKRSEV